MTILQNVFRDYYEEMIYTLHPRHSVVDNVDRMLKCGDPSYGGTMYGCTHCDHLKFVPFRCHSRFCPTCGNMYSIHRTTSMSSKLIQCTHRHCVFTIPDELWPFFLEDRSLLNCLFSAVQTVVLNLFKKINFAENFTPGFISVLHTFSRSLHWKPHIHCLISEGGTGKTMPWRKVLHFDFTYLRNAFRTVLLNLLHKALGSSFKKTKASLYSKHKDGFYVYAKPNKCDPNIVASYVGRYLGRPVIASSRIDDYDGDFVTFHYNRHEDDALVTEKLPALEFMQRLIQHIPEKHFKMIRYYGIYARHRQEDKRLFRAISKEKHAFLVSLNRWQISILRSFGYNPLKCPHCNNTMTFISIYFNNQPISLDDLYKKVMSDFKCYT